MTQLLFTTVYQPLLKAPIADGAKYLDLPSGSIVRELSGATCQLIEVEYLSNTNRYRGWIRSKWAEEYVVGGEKIIKIPNGTQSLSDAAQYMMYRGRVQYNLCGEFCVAYCAGWFEFDIDEWFLVWKAKMPSSFNKIFKGDVARTTGIVDLDGMLSTFEGYKIPSITIQAALCDGSIKRTLLTAGRIKAILEGSRIIIGCKIETQFGRLKGSGVPHWIVVEGVTPMYRGGLVTIYNPFCNHLEYYSWEEFVASVGSPYGIVVPR